MRRLCETGKTLGLSAVLAMIMGAAVAQDAAHDVDKAGKKTEHAVAKVGKKVGKETKAGAEDVGHGTKDAAKGVKTASVKTSRWHQGRRHEVTSHRTFDHNLGKSCS